MSTHRRFRTSLLLLLILSLLVVPLATAAAPSQPAERILVRFAPGADPAARALARANANASFLRSYDLVPGLEALETRAADRAIAALQANPHVLYAEPDYEISLAETRPNDPSYGALWGMENINAPAAWDVSTGDGDFVVAVIDTGVNYNHPDLAANMWTNPGEIPGNGLDDDGNGWVDDVYGYDYCNNDADPMDDHSHGTHCSGTIGGVGNNGLGVAGVNWNVKIMALKFISAENSGWTTDAIACLDYAIQMGAKVSNNSWGGGSYSTALRDAIRAGQNAGHLFIAAAGNEYADNDATPHYPSSYDLDNIISVAAIDSADAKPSFSNWGATSVDLGAPGVSIYSTVLGTTYGSMSGTSMATPHVSGAVAMLYALHPEWGYAEVRDQIFSTVRPVASMDGRTVTGGVLDLGAAVSAPTKPAAPSDLEATAVSDSEIALSWTTNAADATSQVIERAGTDDVWSLLANLAASDTSYTDANLSAGETWQYRVKAVRDGEDSNWSNVAQSTTPIPGVHVATADAAATDGLVSGTYLATTEQDDAYQVITEEHQGGKPSNRHDALDHTWLIPLSGDNYVLHVDAYVVDGGDADNGIAFSYAADPAGPWTEAFVIRSGADTDTYAMASISVAASGALYVRAADTDRTPGENGNDALYVDHIYVDGGSAPTDPPDPATVPIPANGAVDQPTTLTLSWIPGAGATSHVIYLGTAPETMEIVSEQATVGYEASGLESVTAYYWQVNEVNSAGTTTGPTWSFTTEEVLPATTLHVQAITLSAPRTAPPNSSGQAAVALVDNQGRPVAGAVVAGTFTGSLNESATAVTGADGIAVLTTTDNAKKPAYQFCVTGVTAANLTYDPSLDEVACPSYP